ncbi:MAG: ABC transporter [Propionibacteriaceae bacterium]|nr:ABC transporter [Propionibacteriaceae bacterium]
MVPLAHRLSELAHELNSVNLPFPLPDTELAATAARQVAAQLHDYVLPRLANLEAPLLVVVGGSTGAGKSTLVNSLLSRVVSRSSVLRPTTKSPVLVYNPADEHWFDDTRVLAGLTRTRAPSDTPTALQMVPEPSLPTGLALLDSPDIDSVVSANRTLATTLLQTADLWLFVTSAARYSDAVPWGFLTDAAQRAVAMAVVLNRVPPEALNVVPAELRRMMDERALRTVPQFVISESELNTAGLLPEDSIADLRGWLAALAADETERRQVALQTLEGTITQALLKAQNVAQAINDQVSTATALGATATSTYQEAARTVAMQLSDGSLLRGEVLARWYEYVGTSEFTKMIDAKVSWLKEKLFGLFQAQPTAGTEVQLAAGTGLEALLTEAGDAAAERAAAIWDASSAGHLLLAAHTELARSSSRYKTDVARTIREWQSDVLAMVSSQGKDKRKTARIAAAGVNGIGAALMLFIFANTGGLTGAEVGVAGGTTVLAQKLLESVFGDSAVKHLAAQARDELAARVQGLLASELARFTGALDGLGIDTRAPRRIKKLSEEIATRELLPAPRVAELPQAEELLSITAPIWLEPLESVDDDTDIVDAELVTDEPDVSDSTNGNLNAADCTVNDNTNLHDADQQKQPNMSQQLRDGELA